MQSTGNPSRWWDWTSITILFILLETSASRLVTTNWTNNLYLVQTAVYIGFTVGMALGYSRFPLRTARWISFFYMLVMLPLLWTLAMYQDASLQQQLASVFARLAYALSDFFARRPVEDPFLFIAMVTTGFWLLGSTGAFQLVRYQRFIQAVLPSAAVLLLLHHYDDAVSGRIWIIAFFSFLSLILLGRLYYLDNQRSWKHRRVFVSPDNRIDLTTIMAAAAVILILLSWVPPASASGVDSAIRTWNKVTKPWRTFTQRMENAVNPLESPSGGKRGEFYGSELMLGRGFPLSDSLMLTVEAPPLPTREKPPRYYWRGRTYDYFLGGQWYTTGTQLEDFSPSDGDADLPGNEPAEPVRFTMHAGDEALSLIYSPSQTVWVNRQGSQFTSTTGDVKEIVSWFAIPNVISGETYQVEAVLLHPDSEQLNDAGTEYPAWVTEKYLQLPPDFSPRITALAEEITNGLETPYDKTIAVTQYLRQNIEYAETISDPPSGEDPLEWVIFEYKKAYCVYYSSAEILMLRSLGIPARLAVGFAEGERDGNDYVVRRYNAHAWPEVYFPGIGWIEFEPTGSQPALNRPLPPQENIGASGLDLPLPDPRENDREDFQGLVEEADQAVPEQMEAAPVTFNRYLIPVLILVLFSSIYLTRRFELTSRIPILLRGSYERNGIQPPTWVLHWDSWMRAPSIQRAFESINFALRLLDKPMPAAATPGQRAARLERLLPFARKNIATLLDEHQTSLYTSRTANIASARRAANRIRLLAIVQKVRYVFEGRPIENP